MKRFVVAPKTLAENRQEVIDVTYALIPGSALTGVTATCIVYSGSDPTPGAVIGSGPVIDPTHNRVYLPLQGGVVGTIYQIVVKVETTIPAASATSYDTYCCFLVVIPDAI
jgi:hypothetical protein